MADVDADKSLNLRHSFPCCINLLPEVAAWSSNLCARIETGDERVSRNPSASEKEVGRRPTKVHDIDARSRSRRGIRVERDDEIQT